jgi:hypothetical protein
MIVYLELLALVLWSLPFQNVGVCWVLGINHDLVGCIEVPRIRL